MQQQSTPKIYNKTEFSKLLKISTESVDRYRMAGKMPFHQIGKSVRFTESDLIDFLALCAIPATVTPSSREQHEIQKAYQGGEK